MLLHSFKYSLKVWLTSAAIAPLIFFFPSFSSENFSHESLYKRLIEAAYEYGTILTIELVVSFITWVIFLIIIHQTVIYINNRIARLSIISIAGILLTIETFLVILQPVYAVDMTSEFGRMVICTCFCIAAGSWFYKLEPSPKTLTEFNENII